MRHWPKTENIHPLVPGVGSEKGGGEMRVFLWSKNIKEEWEENGSKRQKVHIERIEKMLKDEWVGQGWSCLGDLSKYKGNFSKEEIIEAVKNDFKDLNQKCPDTTIEKVLENPIFKEIVKWLLSKDRIRTGDIIVLLRGGKSVIAIGKAKSEYRFNNDEVAIDFDIAQGLDVQWFFVRDKEIKEFNLNYRTLPKLIERGWPVYGIMPLDTSKKEYSEIQEVLNARKFRGDS